jgi:hypothetical protein
MNTTNNTISRQVNVKVENSHAFSFADLINCINKKRRDSNNIFYKRVRNVTVIFSNQQIIRYKLETLKRLYTEILLPIIALMIELIKVFVTSFNSTVLEQTQETRDGVKAVLTPKLIQSPF